MARWVSCGECRVSLRDGSHVVVVSWCGQWQDFKLSPLSFSMSHFGGFTTWATARFLLVSHLSLSLSCLLVFLFFFSFVFLFGVFGLLGLHFWTYLFFLDLHVGWLAGLNGSQFWRGPKLQSKGGPSLLFLKINLLKNNLGQGGPKSPPVSIPEGTC